MKSHEKIPICTLQPVDCKPASSNKREILEISVRASLRNILEYSFPGKFPTISEDFTPEKIGG